MLLRKIGPVKALMSIFLCVYVVGEFKVAQTL